MSDISASTLTAAQSVGCERERGDGSIATVFLSGLLIVGMPTLFWMGLLEIVNFIFAIGIDAMTRLIVAGALVAILGLIWGFITVSAQQSRSFALEAALDRPSCSAI